MSQQAPIVRLLIILGCLALVVAALAGMYSLAGVIIEQASVTPTPEPTAEPTPTPEPTATPIPVVLAETEDMGQEYIDKFVFIGNSITYRMASEYILPFSQVWVPIMGTMSLGNVLITDINYYPPDDIDNPVEMSIEEAAALRKPEYVMITLGTHDASWMTEDQLKDIYIQLVRQIQRNSPDTKIICNSILPVGEQIIDPAENIHNAEIIVANEWIRDVAEITGTRFLNSFEVMVDETGNMPVEFSPYDGIHLTDAGYNTLFKYIRTHAYQ